MEHSVFMVQWLSPKKAPIQLLSFKLELAFYFNGTPFLVERTVD